MVVENYPQMKTAGQVQNEVYELDFDSMYRHLDVIRMFKPESCGRGHEQGAAGTTGNIAAQSQCPGTYHKTGR